MEKNLNDMAELENLNLELTEVLDKLECLKEDPTLKAVSEMRRLERRADELEAMIAWRKNELASLAADEDALDDLGLTEALEAS